jgi:hypothetical protein
MFGNVDFCDGEDLLSRGKRARASELIDAVYCSALPPYSEMEQLIDLVKGDSTARNELLGGLRDLIKDGGDETGLSWLVVVAGELGREGALTILPAVHYEEEGDILGEAVGTTLKRRAGEALHEILREVHLSQSADARTVLYEALDGVVVGADEPTRERLRLFAMERCEIEKRENPPGLLHDLLMLLQYAGGKDVLARVKEARALCRRGDDLDRNLNDVEAVARGEEDFLDGTRRMLAWSWRDVAKNLEKLFDLKPARGARRTGPPGTAACSGRSSPAAPLGAFLTSPRRTARARLRSSRFR